MKRLKTLCGVLCLAWSGTAAADALATLNDAENFKKAQKDVAGAAEEIKTSSSS